MDKVIRSGENVTKEHNPASNRYIIFREDGTFESGGDPYGLNTGKYTINESGNLFIYSDAGTNDDSMWTVTFAKNKQTMIWKGAIDQRASEFELIHKKVKKNKSPKN